MDLKTGKFSRHWFTDALDRNQKWQDNSFVAVLPVDDHTLLITTGNGIAFFDQRSQKFTKRFFKSADPDNQVFYFQAVKIHPNEYIIGGSKGLVQLNIKTGESTTYTHNNDPKSISAGQVRSICLSMVGH
jgi:ligand-binding sensor domain-containing protein